MAVIGDLHIFDPTPPIDVEADAPDAYRLTLKSMITSWWVLLGSWFIAAAIVVFLGHPLIGLGQGVAGLAFDGAIQAYLRRRLEVCGKAGARCNPAPRDLADLSWIVLARYTLGVAGPLAAVLMQPTVAAVTVLVLMQSWSICVAVVQFAHTTRLMKRALAPLFAALAIGLVPAALAQGEAALAVLVALGMLAWIVLVVARELNTLCVQWMEAMGRNIALRAELARARDAALEELDLALAARAEAGRANAAKSAFLATISHEIRTPLNGVMGMAQAMDADDLTPVQRERLGVIRDSGEGLLTILNDLLDISKIEAGKLELEAVAFDLGAVAKSALAVFAPLAAQKGLALTLSMAGAEGSYQGDPTRIRQVLCNLVSNAVKFTEKGTVEVAMGHEDGRLTATVADTGIGMAPEGLRRLFNSFTQADSSTTRRFGGTGLGLAICKNLVELMGGTINAGSMPGKGTTFVFSVPLRRLDQAVSVLKPARAARDPAPLPAIRSQTVQVLAAEDHPANRLVLQTLLEQIGIEPVIVQNGREAVEAWESRDWDVILMDVQMPVMDGPSAARAIREREAVLGRARTPIIALTANALSHQMVEYIACGMDGHVTKPIEASKLYKAVEDAMSRAAVAQPIQARRLSAT